MQLALSHAHKLSRYHIQTHTYMYTHLLFLTNYVGSLRKLCL